MHKKNKSTSLARSVGALGVVYADIGTSVLYAFKDAWSTSTRNAR